MKFVSFALLLLTGALLHAADQLPQARHKVRPLYPPWLTGPELGQGEVRIRFQVTATGATGDFVVLHSPHPLLTEAALAALKQWRFEPGRKDGQPADFTMELPFVFELDGFLGERYLAGYFASLDGPLGPQLPVLSSAVSIVYPGELWRELADGEVAAEFNILPDGSVADVKIVSATHPAFGASVVAALPSFRFQSDASAAAKPRRVRLQLEFLSAKTQSLQATCREAAEQLERAFKLPASQQAAALDIVHKAIARFEASAKRGRLTGEALERWAAAWDEEGRRLRTRDPARALAALTKAEALYKQALSRDPFQPFVRGGFLLTLWRRGAILLETDRAAGQAVLQQAIRFGRESVIACGVRREVVLRLASVLEFSASNGQPLETAMAQWTEAKSYLRLLDAREPNNLKIALAWADLVANQAVALAPVDFSAALPLWDEAAARYATAATIAPKSAEVFARWADLPLRRASRWEKGEHGDPTPMWNDATEKCTRALELEPKNTSAMHTLALACLRHYARDRSKGELLERAATVVARGESIEPGTFTYLLACVGGLRNRPGECVRWLEAARAAGNLPSRQQVGWDPFLDPVRKSPEFSAWFEKVFPPEKNG